jgi:hypothetical protein
MSLLRIVGGAHHLSLASRAGFKVIMVNGMLVIRLFLE